jgi:hypothetical protein
MGWNEMKVDSQVIQAKGGEIHNATTRVANEKKMENQERKTKKKEKDT